MPTETPGSRKIALVTGGSRGIGRAVVEALAHADMDVTFTFVANETAAQEVVAGLTSVGPYVHAHRVDARDANACKALVESLIA